jgi:hypothetical protein
MTSDNELIKFLETSSGQKEVGFVIAKDSTQQTEFLSFLDLNGFKQIIKMSDLLAEVVKPGKLYLSLEGDVKKDTYDFIAQYSTGQVEIYDHETMRSSIVTPDYRNLSLILLITKEALAKAQSSGYDLLSYAGPAYQL